MIEKMPKHIIDDFKDILKFSDISLKEVWGNKKDDVWERYIK